MHMNCLPYHLHLGILNIMNNNENIIIIILTIIIVILHYHHHRYKNIYRKNIITKNDGIYLFLQYHDLHFLPHLQLSINIIHFIIIHIHYHLFHIHMRHLYHNQQYKRNIIIIKITIITDISIITLIVIIIIVVAITIKLIIHQLLYLHHPLYLSHLHPNNKINKNLLRLHLILRHFLSPLRTRHRQVPRVLHHNPVVPLDHVWK
ncbi:hypothetical protein BDC45DRAFT_219093 [Circinella umbellata]|nr:hypothetical protein BDC45DRAFT_219093 [Circinella umbellata]